MNYEILASELVRALRGKRSQVALSRRLKYRTNAVYKWEAGKDFPMGARFFELAERVGIDLPHALCEFHHGTPSWLPAIDLTSPAGVAAWLEQLRAGASIVSLAQRTGFSRYSISRWLKGTSEIRLDQMLCLIEATSLRLLDFLAALVDPRLLPQAHDQWLSLEATRRAAHEAPWTQAILRALELVDYQRATRHDASWLANRLGTRQEDVESSLALLEATGQIRKCGAHYVPAQILTVDARRDRASTMAQRAFWTRLSLERLESGSPGIFSYNVFGISEKDLTRLRELHAAYFAEMRAIIAESEPTERVVLACTQLFALDDPHGAPARHS